MLVVGLAHASARIEAFPDQSLQPNERVEVIGRDSKREFSVILLTAVETVDNSVDAMAHTETTRV